jgi:hypothetical protein
MHKDGAAIWKRGTGKSHWREACRVAVKHGLRNRNGSFLLGSSLRRIFSVFIAKYLNSVIMKQETSNLISLAQVE